MTPGRRGGLAHRPPSRPPRPERGAAVEFRVHGGLAWITLARGAFRNRLDADVMTGLVDACAAAEDAPAAVVVLAARGPAFSAGLPRGCRWPDAAWPDGVGAVGRLTKPVVAALHGDVLGWGLALALACDVRVAATTAVLGLPDVRSGAFPGGGAVQRLARMIGPARTLEMVLLGTRLAAARAADWGLLTRVVDPGRLDGAVEETARAMSARAPAALRLAKEAVVKGLDLSLDAGIRLEQDLYVLLQTTEDRREGVRAFLERRTPRFGGR